MTAENLLKQARARGATFEVLESGRLKVQAPSPLPDAMMEELRQHKSTILTLLAGEAPANSPMGVEQRDTATLLAWAAQAAEVGLTLLEPVRFLETPLRPYTTAEVGRYCRDQLTVIAMARSNRVTGGWGRFTPEWWNKMEVNSIEALARLKDAFDKTKDCGEELQ